MGTCQEERKGRKGQGVLPTGRAREDEGVSMGWEETNQWWWSLGRGEKW